MRKGRLIAAIVVAFAAGTAFAADKFASSFVDISSLAGGSNGFTNGISTATVYSTGASKSSSCKVKVQFKGLTGLNDGDELWCLGSADVKASLLPPNGAGNTFVMKVPYSSLTGKAQGKADLRNIILGLGCGSTDAINWNGSMECYLPGAYDPATQCTTDGGGFLLPDNPSLDNFIGICQGNALGFRLTPPGTGLVAQQGGTNPLK